MEQKEVILTSTNLLYELDNYLPIKQIYNFLKINNIPSYLFGSCTWRLPFKKQEGHDFDIVIKSDYIDMFTKFIETLENHEYELANPDKIILYNVGTHYYLFI